LKVLYFVELFVITHSVFEGTIVLKSISAMKNLQSWWVKNGKILN